MIINNDRLKVESIIAGYAAAVNSANVSAIVDAYSSDALFIPSGFPSMWGPEEIQQKAEKHFRLKTLSIAFYIKTIKIESGFAFVNAVSTCIITSKATGEKETNNANDFFVLRESDNQWKILRYMFNTK